MRHRLDGARMLITGASQGIGRALAEAAARRGVKVLAAARSAEALAELAAKVRSLGGIIETVVADVTDADGRRRMVEAADRAFGGLDMLVNNAGIGATGHFAEATPEILRRIMEVNFFGLAETTRACLPLLRKSADAVIVNVSSIAGKRGIPARSEYSASKFAVQGFTEAIRAELAKDNIDVLLVCPGLTQTNFSQNMLQQKARLQMDHLRGMTAEQVADATLRAIEAGKRETYTLQPREKLLAFVSRFLPRLADRVARKRVRALFVDEIEGRRRQGASGPDR